ncbi:MAG: hypothetical protein J6I50_02995 [Clostridia bacterium]|nr:hypothetical protein [Clostridia bacterium]
MDSNKWMEFCRGHARLCWSVFALSFAAFLCLNSVKSAGYIVLALCLAAMLCLYVWEKVKGGNPVLPVSKTAGMLLTCGGGILDFLCAVRFYLYWSGSKTVLQLSLALHIQKEIVTAVIALVCALLAFVFTVCVVWMLYLHIKRVTSIQKRCMHPKSWLYYGLFLCLTVIVIALKANYHVDEIYSYGLSNHRDGITISFYERKTYEDAAEPYMHYLTANENHRFDYANVWENQKNDVHPPLYYALLHTISSIFPGTFSRFYAGAINIVFALLTLYFLRKIIKRITDDTSVLCAVSLLFVLLPGILSVVSFLRMYVMAMFFVTLISWYFLCAFDWQGNGTDEVPPFGDSWHFGAKLYFAAVLGALTHYYCIVYTVLISLVYCAVCLRRRQYRSIGILAVSGAAAAVTAYAIFPAMIDHVFSGYRGKESIGNLGGTWQEFIDRVTNLFSGVSRELSGGMFVYLLVFVLFCAGIRLFLRDKHGEPFVFVSAWDDAQKQTVSKCLFLLVPCAGYFLLISKMAVYMQTRYMFPIYAVTVAAVFTPVFAWVKHALPKKAALPVLAAVLTLVSVRAWEESGVQFLYREDAAYLAACEAYADVDCLYVYDKDWKTQSDFLEVQQYDTVTFLHVSHLHRLQGMNLTGRDRMIVMLTQDTEEVRNTLERFYPEYTWKALGKTDYAMTYYIYKEETQET